MMVVTPNRSAAECVKALRKSCNEEVIVAENLAKAASMLRTTTYLAVVLDQFVLEREATELDTVMKQLDTGILFEANVAIC